MAPEQWETPEKVDHRADIYSLGVVFYEMLTGDRPHGVFAPPSSKTKIDNRIDSVVQRAMEREPDLRYQQASEVKEDVTRVVTTPVVPRKSGRVRMLAGWAAMAFLVTLIGGLLWWNSKNEGATEDGPFVKMDSVLDEEGTSIALTEAFTGDFISGQWTQVLTSQAELDALASGNPSLVYRDGWVDASASEEPPTLNFLGFKAINGGVRLRLKVSVSSGPSRSHADSPQPTASAAALLSDGWSDP